MIYAIIGILGVAFFIFSGKAIEMLEVAAAHIYNLCDKAWTKAFN